MYRSWRFVLVVVVLLAAGITPALRAQQATYFPGAEWRTSTPEEQGMDSAKLIALLQAVEDGTAPVQSLTVIRNGYAVLNLSVPPFDTHTLHAMYDLTPALLGTLVGIAIDQGLIQGVDQSIWDFFDEEATANMDEYKAAITVGDLLTQRSGLDVRPLGAIGFYALDENDQDWVQYILDRPMMHEPGKDFLLMICNSHLLSAIIQQASGMTTHEFARQYLFEPLGIVDSLWLADSQGISIGGDGLFLSLFDLSKIAYLYLQNGEWEGQTIVSPAWIETMTAVSTERPFDGWPFSYAQNWWVGELTSRDRSAPASFMMAGGTWMFMIPEDELIVIVSGDQQFKGLTLDATFVVGSVQSDDALPANPEFEARVDELITLITSQTPIAVEPMPETAERISNQRYVLEENVLEWEAVTFTFEAGEAVLTLEMAGEQFVLPIGLDGIDRITPVALPASGLNIVGAPETLPSYPSITTNVALHGSWAGESRFVLTWRDLLGAADWSIGFRFMEENLNMAGTDAVRGIQIGRIIGTPQS